MTLYDWIQTAQKRLAEAGVESARTEAIALARFGLRENRAWVLANPMFEVAVCRLEPLLERRLAREPLAYILGTQEFFGRPFQVDARVLIPRPETETLVETALDFGLDGSGVEILDLGTGSGCIACTLALERPEWNVWASDVSDGALEVARANATALGASVRFLQSDLFAELSDARFDLIVSNPPYVEAGAKLEPEVGRWEPGLALFAGGDGLAQYRRIAGEAMGFLKPEGLLLVEVGDGQASDVSEVFLSRAYSEALRRKDLLGHERVLGFRWKTDENP